MNDLLKAHRGAKLLMLDIALTHDVSVDDILSSSRKATIVAARQEFCARCRADLGLGVEAIGRLIGRDPSTVSHAIITHNKRQQQQTEGSDE